MATIEITVPAAQYADHDDCLAAAARDYVREHKLSGWDLSPRWADDDNREEIILCVPTFSVKLTAETITDDQIRALESEAGVAGDLCTVHLCGLALAAHETAHNDGQDFVGPDGEIWTRTEARENLAGCINAARAMENT